VCDEVRREDNGKLIIIGLYTPNILIPQLPFTFPSLSFFQVFDSDRSGRFPFRARLTHMEAGHEIAGAMGLMEVAQPGTVISMIRFGNLQLDRVGAFAFVVNVNGQPDPISSTFEVILQAAQPRRQ
jgi:hypothetical protein